MSTYMDGGFRCCSPNQTRIKTRFFSFPVRMIEWILIFSIRALLFESNKSEHHGYSCVIYMLRISPCMALDARSAHTFDTFLNRVSPPPCLLTLNVVLATAAVTTLTAPTISLIEFIFRVRACCFELCVFMLPFGNRDGCGRQSANLLFRFIFHRQRV